MQFTRNIFEYTCEWRLQGIILNIVVNAVYKEYFVYAHDRANFVLCMKHCDNFYGLCIEKYIFPKYLLLHMT